MWKAMEKPSILFSNKGSIASGVTSRPVKPVPPVVIMTSITGSSIQAFTRARMASISSWTRLRSETKWPALTIRCTSSAPDLSSLSERVSEIVSTANLSGMNSLLSSIPGMDTPTQLHRSARPRERADHSILDSRLRGNERTKSLQRVRRQRVAGRGLAGIKAVQKPALALFRGAVGEAVGHDIALHLLLQAVVADGGRGLQGLIDVALIEKAVLGLGAVRPDPRIAVRLQLDTHLERIRGGLAGGSLLRLHGVQNA